MDLPLELQRRLDRRWSARFGISEQGSRPDPSAAMIGVKRRNLAIASPDGPNRETPTKEPSIFDGDDRPLRAETHPELNAQWSRLRHPPWFDIRRLGTWLRRRA